MFEYGTLNGGEHSMLAAVDRLTGSMFEIVALAPEKGRLAAVLRKRGIGHIPLSLHDEQGTRLPRRQVCGELSAAIRRCSPDLVHANSLSLGRLTGAIASQLAVPTIAHLRDIIKLSRAAVADLNRNRLLLAVSEATRVFHAEQAVKSDRMRVLYNGVDCQRFRPRPSSGALLSELRLPSDAFLLATIGQIGLRKGQDVLAEAAAISAETFSNVHWLIIGERNSAKAESVEFERSVFNRFCQAGLGDRLHRLGYREDLDRLINEIDLLVHPAHQEPLGRVLLESAAAGLPIIATAVGGTEEILDDGKSARLVPPGDPQALSQAIVELHADADKRARFATAARERALTAFNVDSTAGKLSSLWLEVLGTKELSRRA